MSSIARITDQFNASLLSTLCTSSLVLGIPAMAWNYVAGNTAIAVALGAMVAAFGFGLFSIRRHGVTAQISLLLGSTLTLVISALVYLVDGPAVLWLYPLAVANYVMLTARQALALNLLAIALVLPSTFADTSLAMRFLPSMLLCSIFLHIFSRQLHKKTQMVHRLITQDKLTSAGNRRALDDLMERIQSRPLGQSSQIAMLMLDLDHFKAINDAHGHPEGDKVLQAFSHLISARLRRGDHLFRFGGEEFVVVLEGAGLEGAIRVAEDFRQLVADARLGPNQDLTVSIGVAALGAGEFIDAWITRADSALYEAKRLGRNRVCMA
jgi:diguanylate cyclase (GGDEF)-like protein